jgi:RNA polymerase subunit RPABC4/transcription elongation factor Spt4
MAEIQCGKCGEMVDEAKAFCPGCGHSFVDEKQRTSVSDYDQSKSTVQLGATMFNQMLSDMGLDISKQPDREEKRTELVTPLVPTATVKAPEQKERQVSPEPSTQQASSKWIAIGVILLSVIAFVILVALAAVAAAFFYYR